MTFLTLLRLSLSHSWCNVAKKLLVGKAWRSAGVRSDIVVFSTFGYLAGIEESRVGQTSIWNISTNPE
jgi:hypothetical protein